MSKKSCCQIYDFAELSNQECVDKSKKKVKRVRRPKGLMPLENMLEYGPLPLPGGYQV